MEAENILSDDNNTHTSNKKTRKRIRLSVKVTPDLRRRIKLAALNHDLTLSRYLGQVLEKIVPFEEQTTKE